MLQESDDDESVVSSRFSDLGSPPASNLSVTPTTFNRKLLETSTNTPASHAPAAKSKVVKNLFDDSADAAEKGPARSTRSQRPLVDKAMEELEQYLMYVAPDFDPTVSDVDPEADTEYVDLIKSLLKSRSQIHKHVTSLTRAVASLQARQPMSRATTTPTTMTSTTPTSTWWRPPRSQSSLRTTKARSTATTEPPRSRVSHHDVIVY